MKITLVLMVRDEEKTIEDTLRSWLPIADNVVVVDTGSVDRTKMLAARECLHWIQSQEMRDIGGKNARAYEAAWVDFTTNRNGALSVAGHEFPGTWLVMVDADTRLHGASALQQFLHRRELEDYGTFNIRTLCGNLSYPMHRVFPAGTGWRYVGAVHETPVHPDKAEPPPTTIPGCHQIYQGTDRPQKRAAWEKHLATLLAVDAPYSAISARETHYIAQTYHCLGQLEDAAQWYDIRYNRRDGFEPERWRAGLCLARLLADKPHTGFLALDLLNELARLRPWRAEPWYTIAGLHLDRFNEPHKALAYAQMAVGLPLPGNDEYMIETDVYEWRTILLAARAWEGIGEKGIAQINYNHLLRFPGGLPEADRLFVNLTGA